jgi:hypothetical protein
VSAGGIDNSYCSCPFGFTGQQCDNDINIVIPRFGNIVPSSLQVSGNVVNDRTDVIVVSVKPLNTDGLIFLMVQNPTSFTGDFIALLLLDAKPVLKFDLGSGAATISSPQSIPLGVFTTIELRRDGRMGELVISDVVVATGNSPGISVVANLMGPFYLGGVPDPAAINNADISPVTGFNGCIRSVSLDNTEFDIVERTISGTNVGECPGDICSPNPCQNGGRCFPTDDLLSDFVCSCPEGYSGPRCESVSDVCLALMPCMHGGECHLDDNATVGYRCICTVTHVGPQCETPVGNTTADYAYEGDSYVAWDVDIDLLDVTIISLQVYPNQERADGLLALFMKPSLDFLAVVVENGLVRVRMDLGQGQVIVTSDFPLLSNVYVTITVNRKGRDIDLTVSGGSTVSGTAPGVFSGLNVDNHFYLGGVPSYLVHQLPPALTGVHGFMGCIDEVTVNGQFLNSTEVSSSFNVRHCKRGGLAV